MEQAKFISKEKMQYIEAAGHSMYIYGTIIRTKIPL